MYSKEKGITYGRPSAMERGLGGGVPFGEPAYRQRSRPIRVPANYSGHAVVDGEERPLGSLLSPDTTPPPHPPTPSPEPHFEGLPRVSELGDRRLPQPSALLPEGHTAGGYGGDAYILGETDGGEAAEAHGIDTPPPPSPEASAPSPRSQGGSWISLFGHDLGTEELLLIGMIVFLLIEGGEQEDRGDLTETVILLGLLLLLGW